MASNAAAKSFLPRRQNGSTGRSVPFLFQSVFNYKGRHSLHVDTVSACTAFSLAIVKHRVRFLTIHVTGGSNHSQSFKEPEALPRLNHSAALRKQQGVIIRLAVLSLSWQLVFGGTPCSNACKNHLLGTLDMPVYGFLSLFSLEFGYTNGYTKVDGWGKACPVFVLAEKDCYAFYSCA